MALPTTDPAKRLASLLARVEPGMRIALLNAIVTAKASIGLEELVMLIEEGRLQEAIDAAARAGSVRLAEGYAAVYTIAGKEGAEFLTDVLDVVVDFDQVNVRAVQVMQGERLRLINEFTAEQRRATREAMVDGITRGLNPVEQARNFRQSIGLTAKQQAAVQNYRRLLDAGSSEALTRELRDRRFDRTVRRAVRTGEPLTQAQVDRMVDRYSERYVRYRSEVIARTESLRAVHQGTEEAYLQAIDQGALVPDQLERQWHDAHDARVRSSHRNLNGMVRRIGETFPGANGPLRFPGDPSAPASESVQCRCVLSTRIGVSPVIQS